MNFGQICQDNMNKKTTAFFVCHDVFRVATSYIGQFIPNTAVFGPTKLIGTITTTIASTIPPG